MIRGKETWPFTILCSSLISSVLGIAVYHFYSKCSIKDADEKRRHIWLSKEKKSQEKSKKKEAKRQFRREKKGQRHIEKKQELQVKRKELFARMTQDQKNEQMERIKLARVESYQKLEESLLNGIKVVIDLEFASYETLRECNSLLKQLGCAYGYLKKCPLDRLISLRLASYKGSILDLCDQHGVSKWKIFRHEQSVEDMYSLEQIVYLSPDSENVLTDISSDKVYVIGGIVDRSVRKSETFNKAKRLEVQTARLPLQEILHPRTHILNIDSVVMALNEYANHHDWKRAFDVAIPKRIKTHRRNEQNQS